jgi:integrase
MPKQLTDPGCRAEKSGPARREIADSLLPGLYFVIEQTPKSGRDKDAGRSWAARYRSPLNGKPAKFRLGPFPTVGVSKARDLCRDALTHVAAGRDPRNVKADAIAAQVEAKKAAEIEAGNTVNAAWAEYDQRHLIGKCRPGTRSRFKQDAVHWLPKLGPKTLRAVTKKDCLDVIDDSMSRGPSAANTTLTVLSSFFGFCVERDMLEKSPTMGIKKPSEYRPRERALTDDEIKIFWAGCERMGGTFGKLLQLLLLLPFRRGELARMKFGNIKGRTIYLEAERSKNHAAHALYLPDQALAIINSLPKFRNCDWIFSTNGDAPSGNFSAAKAKVDKLAPLPHWTIHDLRRSCTTGLARIGVSPIVADKLLNHKRGELSAIAAIYQKHDFAKECEDALTRWADHVSALVGASPQTAIGKVVRMKKRA